MSTDYDLTEVQRQTWAPVQPWYVYIGEQRKLMILNMKLFDQGVRKFLE